MNDSTQYKTTLEAQRTHLTSELSSLGIPNPSVPGDWIATPGDPVDAEADENIAADRSEDWQEQRGTLATLETRLSNITRALKKIEGGTFGSCEICNAAISEERLHINPSARTCKEHINDEAQLPL